MKSMSSQHKIISLLKEMQTNTNKLTTTDLLVVLDNLKEICLDKTTVHTLINSVNYLANYNISNSKRITDREAQVVKLIAEGLQNNEIASMLKLSKATVETHRKNIRKKFKINSKDSLFAFAMVFSFQNNS